jgi:hypothetical protein
MWRSQWASIAAAYRFTNFWPQDNGDWDYAAKI